MNLSDIYASTQDSLEETPRNIYKYKLKFGINTLTLADPKFLSILEQFGEPVIYFAVGNGKLENVTINVVLTGDEIFPDWTYLGSCGHDFVTHVFKL